MRALVAIAAPTGPAFVAALRQAWDEGDAVLPVDPRLPRPAHEALLAATRPAAIVDSAGERHALAGGVPVEAGDALVVATSGTTGEPRAAVLTMSAVEAAAQITSARLAVDPTRDVWLACLPVAHAGGLGVVTRALITGTPLVAQAAFDPTTNATLVSLVPTQLTRHDTSRFRTVVLGGSAPPNDLPPNVVTTYGLTETGGGVVYDGVPLDGIRVRLGDNGEVQLNGPTLLRAYRDGTQPRDPDGWLATQDAGHLAADGRLIIDGRLDDVITTGGEKVWPAAVERVLASAPGVGEVAVAGRVHAEWGEEVVAFVVPVDRNHVPTLRELRDHVRHVLPAYAAPRDLVVLDALPRTLIGKTIRSQLPFHARAERPGMG